MATEPEQATMLIPKSSIAQYSELVPSISPSSVLLLSLPVFRVNVLERFLRQNSVCISHNYCINKNYYISYSWLHRFQLSETVLPSVWEINVQMNPGHYLTGTHFVTYSLLHGSTVRLDQQPAILEVKQGTFHCQLACPATRPVKCGMGHSIPPIPDTHKNGLISWFMPNLECATSFLQRLRRNTIRTDRWIHPAHK